MNKLSLALPLTALLPIAALFAACSGNDANTENTAGSGGTSGGLTSSAGEPASGGNNASAGQAAQGGATQGGATSTAGQVGQAGQESSGGANGSGLGPSAVPLGTAEGYAILAKSAISNVPTSSVTGALGLSPAAASYITGFSLTKAGSRWTSAQVVGGVFAADNDPPTPTDLTTAVADMQTAYTDAAGRKLPDFLDLGGGAIGGLTLEPGLYKWTSTVTIPTNVTLAGSADAVWIFQVTGDLKLAAAQEILLSGGAQPAHIFWQVAGTVDLGTTSHAEGILLSKTAIKLQAGSSINGRLLAQTAVNIASATVTEP